MNPEEQGAILTRKKAIAYLHIGANTFDRHVHAGRIPSWVDEDTGRRRYPKAALDLWLARFADKASA